MSKANRHRVMLVPFCGAFADNTTEIVFIMRYEHNYDIVVIGGGLAGWCAAIAAGRCGSRVALVQDRPVLGGNASGELKIHIAGADCSGSAIARFVRETGIIDELRVENLYRNPTGAPEFLSLLMREAINSEPNVDLFLNTYARAVLMASKDRIEAIKADQMMTEKNFCFNASVFIDATGDGVIAAKAGAEFRWGREAAADFGESLAPKVADKKTLPSCIQFYLKDMGQPTPFSPPSWAYRYPSDEDLPHRGTEPCDWQFRNFCGGFWWLSCGGDRSTITDNESIYEELLRVLMGIWDHMKNHGDHGAENYALMWITPFPGKRESRRVVGDFMLSQQDLIEARSFADAVAYGGWPIDLHPPEGVFSKEPPNMTFPLARPYQIPFRCLYSKNIDNLMFAGRNISCSHVAMGSTRIMATCGVIGQACGVGASIAVQQQCTPRGVGQDHISQVQQTLLRQGVFIPGCNNKDEHDLARKATVTASGAAGLTFDDCVTDSLPLEYRTFQLFPISSDHLDCVEVLLESSKCCRLRAGLCKADDIWDFSNRNELATVDCQIDGSGRQWVSLEFDAKKLEPGLYWIWVEGDSAVKWCAASEAPIGCVRGKFQPRECLHPELAPVYQTMRGSFIFRLSPESQPFSPKNVIRNAARPEQRTNAWISPPLSGGSQWLQLGWAEPVAIDEIHLTFDGQLDNNLIWPAPTGVFGSKTLAAVAKSYHIQAMIDGHWTDLHKEMDNYQPHRQHHFAPIQTDTIRLLFNKTHAADEVRLYEVRVYSNV